MAESSRNSKDFDLAKELLLAVPVRYGRDGANPRWEPRDHKDIKDLRKAVKESGLSSPYFKHFEKLEVVLGALGW